MKSEHSKDTVFNSIVLFAAWMIVIATCVTDDVETSAQVVRVAYRAQ
jgi:hypothetical protein